MEGKKTWFKRISSLSQQLEVCHHIETEVQHLRCPSYLRPFPLCSLQELLDASIYFGTDFTPQSKSRQLLPSRQIAFKKILTFTALSFPWILWFIQLPVAATGSCLVTFKFINYLEKTPFHRDSSINYLVFEQVIKTFRKRTTKKKISGKGHWATGTNLALYTSNLPKTMKNPK